MIVKAYSPSVPLNMSEETKKNNLIWEQKDVDRIEIIPDIALLKCLLCGKEEMFKYGENRIEVLGNPIDGITQ